MEIAEPGAAAVSSNDMHIATGAVGLGLTMLLASACASSGIRQPQPETGTLTVGVSTSGSTAANMTFRVLIEPGGIAERIKADAGIVTRRDVAFGTHTVRLVDVPSRCQVEGGSERTIGISQQRRMAVVRFDVRCPASPRPDSVN